MTSTSDTPVMPRRRDDVMAIIALAIGATAFLWPIVGGGQRLAGGDIINNYLPYRHVVNQAIGAGEWPWWNPWSFCGQPLVGNLNAALFYPPNLLSIWISLPFWFGFTLWLHVMWGLAGAYLFHRRVGLLPPSALLGAVFFWGSGFFIFNVFSGIVLFHQAGAWWPWLMMATLAWVQTGNRRWIAIGGASLALMFLSGAPQIFYYATGVSLATGVMLCLSRAEWRKRFLGVMVMLALAGLLMQVQFQPARAQSALSQRANYEGEAAWRLNTGDSLMWRSLGLALVPQMNGDLTTRTKYYGTLQGFHEVVPAVMTPPLLLIAIGLILWRWRRGSAADNELPLVSRRVWLLFHLAVGGLALWAAFGLHSPLFKLLWSAVPGFSEFRVPARLSLITLWCLSSVAALAFDEFLAAIRTGSHRRAWAISGWVTAIIGVVVTVLFTLIDTRRILYLFGMPEGVEMVHPSGASATVILHAHLRQNPDLVEMARRSLLTWGIAISLTGLGIGLWGTWRRLWMIGVGTFAAACLLTLPPRLDLNAMDAEEFDSTIYRRTPVIDAIEENIEDGRILCFDSVYHFLRENTHPGLVPNRALMFGIPQTRGYDPIIPQQLAWFTNVITGLRLDQPARGRLVIPGVRDWELVGLMNVTLVAAYDDIASNAVRQIWADGTGLRLYQVRNPVGAGRWMPDWGLASDNIVDNLNALAGHSLQPFDNERTVILEEPVTPMPTTDASPSESRVTLDERGFGHVTFTVEAPGPGYLLTDVYHHPGWQAWVNGERALVSRGNLLWCAVPVDAGTSRVELKFRPTSLLQGALLTFAGLLLLVATLIVGRGGVHK